MKNPYILKTDRLGEFTRMIASLGGYLNRKCDGPPGTKTMWVGLQRMVDFALAWKAFGQVQPETRKGKKGNGKRRV
ncbi:MAG: IS4 family transposase [Planctomycetota bacterium]